MPKRYRLNDSSVIKLCLQRGRKIVTKYFIIRYITSEDKNFAILISKKYSKKATDRNKIRRQIKYAIYTNINSFNTGSYVIISKNNITPPEYNQIESDLLSFLSKN